MTIRRVTFPTGLAAVADDWTGNTFKWALTTAAWTQDESSQVFISSVAAFELTDGSYSRVAMTTPSVSIVLPAAIGAAGAIRYLCDSPDFGVLVGGEIASALVLYQEVTVDADSPIVCAYPCAYSAEGLSSALFVLSLAGAVDVSTVCPDGF